MQMTTEVRKKITGCLTEYLTANPGTGREALTEGVLAALTLSARTLRDTSPSGKANIYRSYIGTVLTELTVEGKVKRVGKGYFLAGEGLVIVRPALRRSCYCFPRARCGKTRFLKRLSNISAPIKPKPRPMTEFCVPLPDVRWRI